MVAASLTDSQSHLLSVAVTQVAVALNDYENYRTNTQYEDALIAKNFVFQARALFKLAPRCAVRVSSTNLSRPRSLL